MSIWKISDACPTQITDGETFVYEAHTEVDAKCLITHHNLERAELLKQIHDLEYDRNYPPEAMNVDQEAELAWTAYHRYTDPDDDTTWADVNPWEQWGWRLAAVAVKEHTLRQVAKANTGKATT